MTRLLTLSALSLSLFLAAAQLVSSNDGCGTGPSLVDKGDGCGTGPSLVDDGDGCGTGPSITI